MQYLIILLTGEMKLVLTLQAKRDIYKFSPDTVVNVISFTKHKIQEKKDPSTNIGNILHVHWENLIWLMKPLMTKTIHYVPHLSNQIWLFPHCYTISCTRLQYLQPQVAERGTKIYISGARNPVRGHQKMAHSTLTVLGCSLSLMLYSNGKQKILMSPDFLVHSVHCSCLLMLLVLIYCSCWGRMNIPGL